MIDAAQPRTRSSTRFAPIRRSGGAGPRTLDDDGDLLLTQRRFPRLRSTYVPGAVPAPRRAAGELGRRGDPRPDDYARPGEPDWLSGGCVLMRRAALDEARRPGRGLLPVLRGDRPVPSPAGQWVVRPLRAARDGVPQVLRVGAPREHCPDPGLQPGALRAQASRCARHPPGGARGRARRLAHAAAWAHRPARRRGHLAAARAALRASPHRRRHADEQPHLRDRHARAQRAREPAAPRRVGDRPDAAAGVLDDRRRRLRRRHGRSSPPARRRAPLDPRRARTGDGADDARARAAGAGRDLLAVPPRRRRAARRRSTSSSRSTPTRRSTPTTSTLLIAALRPSSPTSGIAGGSCYELEDGDWERRRSPATHPRGASRAYRWDCCAT